MRIRGANPYVLVSARRAAQLKPGWRRPMPVRVRIDGRPDPPWRINMMPTGTGAFYLYLHGGVRKASGTGVGDRVTVELAFDTAYRNGPMHPMPKWFAAALKADAKARRAWDALIPSRQKEILRHLASLKSREAQQRNLERAMAVLGGRPGRFMARSWKDGK